MDFRTVKQVAELLNVTLFKLQDGRVAVLNCRICGAVSIRGGIATATYVSKDGSPVLRETLESYSLDQAIDELVKFI